MFMKYCTSVVFSNINVQKKYILPIDREGESLQLAPDFPRPGAHPVPWCPHSLTVTVTSSSRRLAPSFPRFPPVVTGTHDVTLTTGCGLRHLSHVCVARQARHFLVTGSVVDWSHAPILVACVREFDELYRTRVSSSLCMDVILESLYNCSLFDNM